MPQNIRLPFLLSLFVAVALFSRWIPHPPNFTAVGALALFSGLLLRGRSGLALLPPVATLLVSDLVLGFHSTFLWVYLSFILVAVVGRWSSLKMSPLNLLAGSLLTSGLFFVVSNWGVWLVGGLYPQTVTGLLHCYGMAVPFLGNQILGDLFFVGIFALLTRVLPVRELLAVSRVKS